MKPTARRVFLKGSLAAVTIGGAPAAGAGGDAKLAVLAAAYWRNLGRIHGLIDTAERRDGACAWLGPPYAARYDELAAWEARLIAAIAGTPPDSIAGLATKMRVATLSADLESGSQGDLLTTVFLPALSDLDRLAAGAGP